MAQFVEIMGRWIKVAVFPWILRRTWGNKSLLLSRFAARRECFYSETFPPDVWLSLPEARSLASGNQLEEKAFLSVIKPALQGVKRIPEQLQAVANGSPGSNVKFAVCPSITRPRVEAPGQNQARTGGWTDGHHRCCSLRHRQGGVYAYV